MREGAILRRIRSGSDGKELGADGTRARSTHGARLPWRRLHSQRRSLLDSHAYQHATRKLMAATLADVVASPLRPVAVHERRRLWLDALESSGDAGRILTRSEFELLAQHARGTAEDESTISKDLTRSRIGGSSADELSTADQAVLQQILRVYAVLDPGCGYCQGMNFVATLCLHVLPGGVGYDAFCLFTALLLPEGLGLRTLYTDGFHTAMCVVHAVEAVASERDQELDAHLQQCGTGLSGSILPWVITLFSAALPLGPTLCCWDRLLLGLASGPTAPRARTVLAVLCIAVLDCSRDALLTSNILETPTFHRLVGEAAGPLQFAALAGRMLRDPTDLGEILRHTAEFDAAEGSSGDVDTDAVARRQGDVQVLVRRARAAEALEARRAAEAQRYGAAALAQLEAVGALPLKYDVPRFLLSFGATAQTKACGKQKKEHPDCLC